MTILFGSRERASKARAMSSRLIPTALVHECYVRLADQTRLDVESRAHFYSIPPVGWRAGSADCIFVPPTWKSGGSLSLA
jgi:hypothetical protein